MQRQSLGSPGRERPVLLDDAVLMSDDSKRRDSSSASSFSAVVDDKIKPEKPNRFGSHRPESFIHLIPVLIVFCFLVLYFSSHDPSPQDLTQFHGLNYKHPEHIIEMKDIDEIGRIDNKNKEVKRSGAYVIRSQRNLQEEIIQRDIPNYNHPSHRKLGYF